MNDRLLALDFALHLGYPSEDSFLEAVTPAQWAEWTEWTTQRAQDEDQ